jgi:hypothetical protein
MKCVTPILFCLAGLCLQACSEAASEPTSARADQPENSASASLPEVIT